jgi:predicted class III extradiol MEMO1 family dioxygenase
MSFNSVAIRVIITFIRYKYTYYNENHGAIHKSIEALDRMGMEIIEVGSTDAFSQYMQEYKNTICGRHPISVFLHVRNILVTMIISLLIIFIL